MSHPAKPRVPLQGTFAGVHTQPPRPQGGRPETAKGTSEPRPSNVKFGHRPEGVRGSRSK